MRKIFALFFLVFSYGSLVFPVFAAENLFYKDPTKFGSDDCVFSKDASISDSLKNCKPEGMVETADDRYTFDGGAKERIIQIANQIIVAGSILAIASIVYGGFLYMTMAVDEKAAEKAKNSVKYGIIGFVVMLISFPLVNAIVNLFYSVGQ